MGFSKIEVKREGSLYEFVAKNGRGGILNMSSSAAMGGVDNQFRPMEALLASLASCSAIDIINILSKQKNNPVHFSMEVTGERDDDAVPGIFHSIQIIVKVSKDVDESKLLKAINLTQEKYCSVLFMIKQSSNVKYSHTYV